MKTTLKIEGMSCHHCVHAVDNALRDVEGITVEHVEIGSATVSYKSDSAELRTAVHEAIEEEGYMVVGEDLR